MPLSRAKLRAAAEHFQNGRRLTATGKFEEALVEYQLASELNPSSHEIDEALKDSRNQLRARIAVARDSPRESAASIWPEGLACRPAR